MNEDLGTLSAQAFDRYATAMHDLRLATQRHKACRIGLAKAENLKEKAVANLVDALMNNKTAKHFDNMRKNLNECSKILERELHTAKVDLLHLSEIAKREAELFKAIQFLNVLES